MAEMLVAESEWSLREIRLEKEILCFTDRPRAACYKGRFVFEIFHVSLPADLTLGPITINLRKNSFESTLGDLTLSTLSLSGGCSPCVITVQGELRAYRAVNAALLARIRDGTSLEMRGPLEVHLYGYAAPHVFGVRKRLLVHPANLTIVM
ncbi:hypothetical protein FOZ62_025894 [Perkinsus olseni]|uniref:Uncharacterized protein n=1 Tax=Perkinsus olseni TaxID=32597 RepID=A0A7J6RED5_PEROL|nr:hypothetical protein FOZ62_025894 [Perkinsus olseni]